MLKNNGAEVILNNNKNAQKRKGEGGKRFLLIDLATVKAEVDTQGMITYES